MAEDFITVEAGRDNGRVALWEKDPAHPDGEAFIAAGNGRHRVARTGAVLQALADGRLIERPALRDAATKGKEPKPADAGGAA